jgi:type IV pilus assembly protein PilO
VGRLLGEAGPRRNIQLGLVALALLDVVFYLFAIGPLAESDRARALLVENLRRQVEERTAHVAKLTTIAQKVETARTEGDKLLDDITLPRRTAFSTIVSELDEAGRQAGIELRDRAYGVEPIEGSDTLSMMTVTTGLEGSYENLVRFLNRLDRSPRFLIIESLGAAPQQSGPQQNVKGAPPHQPGGLLNVTVRFDTFVRES